MNSWIDSDIDVQNIMFEKVTSMLDSLGVPYILRDEHNTLLIDNEMICWPGTYELRFVGEEKVYQFSGIHRMRTFLSKRLKELKALYI